jgi:hypothetical protein
MKSAVVQKEILRIVAKTPGVCNYELAETLGLPYRTIQRATWRMWGKRLIFPACGTWSPRGWILDTLPVGLSGLTHFDKLSKLAGKDGRSTEVK